ncbi:hypothetical protein R1sor_009115 [Riccia sorocarpa]|uniref:SWIM-type domain-containing protein n=1 Tax=Riccia sorocarpa TaxID=122646 RepID=A0ABD3H6R5_9MARC
MGRGGGNGPSLFELHLRSTARLGTTNAFEKAFDFAIRRTAPLANISHIISGDINTTSRKRKGPPTSTIQPTDTHRHDRVAVTTQVKRTVRGRLSFDFEPPQHAIPEPGESSRPPVSAVTAVTTFSSSTDDSAEPERENDVTDSPPVQRNLEVPVYTFITSLSSDNKPAEIHLQEHPFPVAEPEIAGPAEPEFEVPEEPYFPVPAEPEFEAPGAPHFEVLADPEIAVPEPYIADPDEPEVVVLGVTPRRRPNTRASVTRQREHINEVMQHGQPIQEQHVDKRFWHLSRINQGGHPSAMQRWSVEMHPGLSAKPESSLRDCRCTMPKILEVMPVQLGTKITQAECDFLTVNGFVLVHRIPSTTHQAQDFPSIVDIRINVDLYAQKVQSVPSTFRFNSRGQKQCRRKTTASNECMNRLQSARTTTMLLTGQWEVREGNGYGKMFQISTHLGADMRRYIVQLCCFPTCSCEDFFTRETQVKTFTPCKHIYWVYLNVLGVNPQCKLIHQPVLTKIEVEKLLSMQSMAADERLRVDLDVL